jgi:hypothetical protein
LELTRICRSSERASLEKKPSMRLSHDPCSGVNVKVKRPMGCAASQLLARALHRFLFPVADHRRMNLKIRRQLRQGLLPRKRCHRHSRLEFRACCVLFTPTTLVLWTDQPLADPAVQKPGAAARSTGAYEQDRVAPVRGRAVKPEYRSCRVAHVVDGVSSGSNTFYSPH